MQKHLSYLLGCGNSLYFQNRSGKRNCQGNKDEHINKIGISQIKRGDKIGMDIIWNNRCMRHWLDSHKDIFNNHAVVFNRKKIPFSK